MRTFARLLILVLGLTAATSVFYAFQQQNAVRTAQSAAESLEKERAALRKQLWEAERRRQELEARMRSNGGDSTLTIQTETGEFTVPSGEGPQNGPPAPRNLGRALAAFEFPEAQRLMAVQQRGALDSTYADLFRSLNLSPAQLERFKDLLVEKRTAVADVMAAARSQGLTGRDSRDEIRALVQDTQSEIDESIRSALGETAYQQYQNYERTQPQRAVANQLSQRLSYSATPLTPQQSDQVIRILASTAPPRRSAAPASNAPSVSSAGAASTSGSYVAPTVNNLSSVNLADGAGRAYTGRVSTPITDQAIQQAGAVLNATQLQALRQLQAEQQARTELSELMRTQFQQRRGGAQSGGTSGAPSASSATPPKG